MAEGYNRKRHLEGEKSLMSIKTRFLGFLRLIRPLNCLMMGFSVIIGTFIASGNNYFKIDSSVILGFLTGFSLTATSMILNDYYDIKVDSINEPKRPIVSGIVKPKEALILSLILTIIGILTSILINLMCFVTAIIAWIIFLIYTTIGKKTGLPGNILVSVCVSIPFIYGGLISGEIKIIVFLFVIMVFLSNTGREITKGIVDLKGDQIMGIKTLAVQYGTNVASLIAVLFYFFAILLSPLPLILGIVSFWFIPFVLITDFGLFFSSFFLLKKQTRERARLIKNLALFYFLSGLFAFIFGKF